MKEVKYMEVLVPDYEHLYKDQKHYVKMLEKLVGALVIIILAFVIAGWYL